jgi:hypothetical protein
MAEGSMEIGEEGYNEQHQHHRDQGSSKRLHLYAPHEFLVGCERSGMFSVPVVVSKPSAIADAPALVRVSRRASEG